MLNDLKLAIHNLGYPTKLTVEISQVRYEALIKNLKQEIVGSVKSSYRKTNPTILYYGCTIEFIVQ